MKKAAALIKKYWITVLIYVGLVLAYMYVTESGKANTYLFPTVIKLQKPLWKIEG